MLALTSPATAEHATGRIWAGHAPNELLRLIQLLHHRQDRRDRHRLPGLIEHIHEEHSLYRCAFFSESNSRPKF